MGNFSGVIISAEGKTAREAEQQDRNRKLRRFLHDSTRDGHSTGSTNGIACPDEGTRQRELMEAGIQRLQAILAQAQVAPAPTSRKILAIGHYATFTWLRRNPTRDGSDRVRETYQIVGFEEGDCSTVPPKLSYQTDIPKAFLGGSVGDQETIYRNGKPILMTLTSIRLKPLKRTSRSSPE